MSYAVKKITWFNSKGIKCKKKLIYFSQEVYSDWEFETAGQFYFIYIRLWCLHVTKLLITCLCTKVVWSLLQQRRCGDDPYGLWLTDCLLQGSELCRPAGKPCWPCRDTISPGVVFGWGKFTTISHLLEKTKVSTPLSNKISITWTGKILFYHRVLVLLCWKFSRGWLVSAEERNDPR